MRYKYTTRDIPISDLDLLKDEKRDLLRYKHHRIIYRDDHLFCIFRGNEKEDIFNSVENYSERYYYGVDYWFSWNILKDFSEYLSSDKDFCEYMERDKGYKYYYEYLEGRMEETIENIKEEESEDIFDVEMMHDPFWWSDYALGNEVLPKYRKEIEGLREGKECIIKHGRATGIDIIYKERGKKIFRYNLEDIETDIGMDFGHGYIQAKDHEEAKERIREKHDLGKWNIEGDYITYMRGNKE